MTITQAQLNAEIITNLPTTGGGAITAAITRQTLTDMTTAIFQSANVLNVGSFGAKGDGITDDTTALNTAFAFGSNNKVGISLTGLLGNVFKITSPLFATPQGSIFQTCYIVGAGRGYASSSSQTVIDATAITNAPAIIIQRGRGCYLGQFLVLGGNTAPGALSLPNMLYGAAWVSPGLRDSRYSPYCGISIDGGVGSI